MATTAAPAGNAQYIADLQKNIFELLGGKDKIYIKQGGTGRECLEMASGCEISNRFTINTEGHDSAPIFQMKEDSNCCVRQCCKQITPFEMVLSDMGGQPQITYSRPFHCTNTTCCCPCGYLCNPCAADCCCGTQELFIKTNSGEILGRVYEKKGSWCGLASWVLEDAEGNEKMVALVPCCELCRMCCCQDVDLQVFKTGDTEDNPAATITRKCICDCVNVMTDKDHFEIQFENKDLTPLEKFYVMSMTILIKYMHFEQGDQ